MNNFGPFSNFKGEYSNVPAFAVGKDSDHIAYLTALSSQLLGVAVPNKTVNLTEIEREHNFKIFAVNDSLEKLCGKRYQLPINNYELHDILVNGRSTSLSKMPLSFGNEVIQFLRDIIYEYGDLFLNVYTSTERIKTLESLVKGLRIIGPDPKIKERFSKKTEVHSFVKDLDIPVVDGYIVNSIDEAYSIINNKKWKQGAFVSLDLGSGGIGCLHVHDPNDIFEEIHNYRGSLFVTEWLHDIVSSPNILSLIGNGEVLPLAVTDQILEETKYIGNEFPPKISKKNLKKIEQYTKIIGQEMSEKGYRGLFGIDWIVTKEGSLYFGEINPRKNHSTTQNVFMLELAKKRGAPPVSYLEILAVLNEPLGAKEEDYKINSKFSWLMKIYKKRGWSFVQNNPCNGFNDRNIFLNSSAYGIMNYPLEGTIIPFVNYSSKEGNESFYETRFQEIDVCRIVSVGKGKKEVNKQLRRAYTVLDRAISKMR